MAKFRKKSSIVDAITFTELIDHGLKNCEVGSIVNGMPWSFEYNGHMITHEDDECYLLPTKQGDSLNFTPEDMLITDVNGSIYPMRHDVFCAVYEGIKKSYCHLVKQYCQLAPPADYCTDCRHYTK